MATALKGVRAEVKQKPLGLIGAYVVGIAFAFGWTPCIGPILAGILLYASQQETVTQGVVLLSAYSAGLGIPFIAAGLAVNWFFAASARIKTQMRKVEIVSGVLLIGVGLLLVTDRLSAIAQWFTRMFPALARHNRQALRKTGTSRRALRTAARIALRWYSGGYIRQRPA